MDVPGLNPRLQIRPFAAALAQDLERLFATDPSAHACWCMWFIGSVKDFHLAGAQGNRAGFEALARQSSEPLGLLAYEDGEPVAWCAVGPKQRFARAVRTPTLKGHVAAVVEPTWFVPCFFVRRDRRRAGITRAMLAHATALAATHGAGLVEGFPFASGRSHSGGDRQVGSEGVFAECGFA
ncbi:MAG TPA: GNAT family N-acetyltransferase, partial [Rubrivivax sp.]